MFTLTRTKGFAEWIDGLKDAKGRARVLARLAQAEGGNFGDCEPVGDGVSEMRIHFGPGYRVFFVRRGQTVFVVLGGGDKSTQDRDISRAKELAKGVLP